MSELEDKWFWAYPTESVDCDGITGSAHEVYSKSDVDSVIAELKDKCQMHDFFWEGCGFAKRGFKNSVAVSEAFDELEVELAEKDKELRHQKYNRCLAMAKMCDEVMMSCELRGYTVHRIWANKHEWAMRWKYRWLELAEKFKELK